MLFLLVVVAVLLLLPKTRSSKHLIVCLTQQNQQRKETKAGVMRAMEGRNTGKDAREGNGVQKEENGVQTGMRMSDHWSPLQRAHHVCDT